MGCASSTASPEEAAARAGKQRRKLSLAPGHVGDISPDAAAGGVQDDDVTYQLTEQEVAAKGSMNHFIHSRKGFVPYNKKKINQDRPVLKYAVGDHPEVSMFGVMDGHGEFGHDVSSFVQTNLPKHLGTKIDAILADPHQGITDAVLALCKELDATEINCSFSGTTCVFGVRVENKMYVANIGDSRGVMCQKVDGKIKALDLSEDHKPESPLEKERIIAAGGRVETLPGPPGEDCGPFRVWLAEVDVPGLAMSRSIGDGISQTVGVTSIPEIRDHTICDEDMFCIFASDGVWEFISSEEAVEMVWSKRNDMEAAAKLLVDESTARWRREEEVIDDITCTIIQFNPFE